MKPAKKSDRIIKPEEKIVHKKKHFSKPWVLEYKIVDEKLMNDFSWFKNTKKIGEWFVDHPWGKYTNPGEAIGSLKKLTKSFIKEDIRNNWHVAGREFRVVNLETKESITLVITATEIYAEREEGRDTKGSSDRITEIQEENNSSEYESGEDTNSITTS